MGTGSALNEESLSNTAKKFQQTLTALEAMPCIWSGLPLRLAAQPRPRIICI